MLTCQRAVNHDGIANAVVDPLCSWKFVASRRLLDMAGVQYTQHRLQRSKVVIDFTSVR